MIILQLVCKHGGSRWLLYDRQFRLQQAAGASLSWADINLSLMAATVLGQPNERPHRACSLCLAADHFQEECALASLESHRPPIPASSSRPPISSRQGRRPLSYRLTGPCFRFKAGSCNSTNCCFEHICTACSAPGHPEIVCPKLKGQARSRQGDTKPGASPSQTTPAAEKPRP